ncbi:MAG: signal recognition particle-docking protein FtsY, partial [Prochlorotrichaceae cyanobacterium]
MVFDWFRRKFDKSAEKTEPPAVPEETLESTTVEAGTAEPVAEESEAAPEDEYLAWAKAAYQNLKQQQAPSAEPAASPSAEPAASPSAEPVVVADSTPAIDPVADPTEDVPPAV